MESRNQFTFYKSIFEAVSRIKKKADRADAYDIICAYGLLGKEPDLEAFSDAVAIAFISCKPNLAASRKKAAGGKKGGSSKHTERISEASREESRSIPEASPKREETVSEKENEKELEKENEKELEIENECYSCAEPESAPAPPAFFLPLNDKTNYPISLAQVEEWKCLYPAVDVMQQLRNMKGWLDANPSKRKTKAGILRFVVGWLAKEQDRGGLRGVSREQAKPIPNYDEKEKWGL